MVPTTKGLRRTAGRRRGFPIAALVPFFFALNSSTFLLLPPVANASDCPIPGTTLGEDNGNQDDDDDGRTLFIHVVPHTHDDVGWLKTVDQYYHGYNSTIQRAQVKYILDTVILALLQNPARKFTYVEMAFFTKWYYDTRTSDETRNAVKDLVKNGRLSFANGGWCMHDEAATHFMGMIDQTTLGHAFLLDELGVIPKVGWQLDPFGHSATQASLMTSKMGFDALYFGRIDYQDLDKRHRDGQCEGFWSASPDNLGDDAKVFWGLTGSYGGNYGPPPGFCFDDRCDDDYLVGADEDRLKERVVEFLGDVKVQAGRTKGRHVMLTVGSDFQYSNAFINFENYDYLIETVRRYQSDGVVDVPSMFSPVGFDSVRIFYSNPEIYTRCKHDDYLRMTETKAAATASLPLRPSGTEGATESDNDDDIGGGGERRDLRQDDDGSIGDGNDDANDHAAAKKDDDDDGDDVWETKTDDFFPYSDCDHCYWTGYFTSRQSLKRLERAGSSFLHAARQIESYREQALITAKGVTGNSRREALPHDSDGKEDEGSGNGRRARRDTRGGDEGAPPVAGGGGSEVGSRDFPLRKLEEAMGVAQHHDAVSGTSKQHVAFDYAKRIWGGMDEAANFAVEGLRTALLGDDESSYTGDDDALGDLMSCLDLNVTVCKVSQDATKSPGTDLYAVIYNALRSRDEFVSIPITAKAEYQVERLTAIAATGVAGASSNKEEGSEGISAARRVKEQRWEVVPSVRVPNSNNSMTAGAAPYALHFDAGMLPPNGAAVFRIRMMGNGDGDGGTGDEEQEVNAGPGEDDAAVAATAAVARDGNGAGSWSRTRQSATTTNEGGGDAAATTSKRSLRAAGKAGADLDRVISNGHFDVHFEGGLMTRVTGSGDSGEYFDQNVKIAWGYYTSFDSSEDEDKSHQNSGAYIFRPKAPNQSLHVLKPDVTKSWIFHSDLVTEVHVGFDVPWMRQITRIRKGRPYVDVEYTIGPIPVDDGEGKEVVARYSTGIQSEGTFYTDSNGREFIERKRGYRPTWNLTEYEPVAGNYYPINAAVYIEDDSSSLAVLVDRSQGGSSLMDGTVELMVQRRILADDGRGVGEPLNETVGGVNPYPPYGDAKRVGEGVIITGTHRLMLGGGRSGAKLARRMMDGTWSPPHVFVASSPSSTSIPFLWPGFSGVGCDFPPNVMVVTHSLIESVGTVSTFLVRFAHQYAAGEDDELSKPVSVDLKELYGGYVRVSIAEMTLSGNQRLEEWEKTRLRWDKHGKNKESSEVGDGEGAAHGNAASHDDDDEWIVRLKPMEIKTFLVKLST